MPKQQYLTDLTMRIGADTASLRKGLDKAKGQVKRFSGHIKGAGKQIKSSLSSLSSGLTSTLSPQLAMINMGFKTIATTIKGTVIPSIASMGVALGVATGGITIALAAIVAGAMAVKTWINRTVEGTEQWSLITAKIGGYWEGIMDRVSLVGKYIWGLVTGNKEMKEEASAAWGELKTLGEYAEENVKIQKEDNELWHKKMKYIEDAKQLEYEAAELKKKAYDEDAYNAEERKGFINEAIRLQKQASDKRIEIAKQEYDLQVRRNKMADSNKEDLEKENELKQVYLDALKTAEKRETTLISKKVSIVKQANAEKEAVEKALIADRERLAILTKRMELLTGQGEQEQYFGGKKASESPFIPTDEESSKALTKQKDRIAAMQEQADQAAEQEIQRLQEVENRKTAIRETAFQTASSMMQSLAAMQSSAMQRELKAAEGNEAKQEAIRKKYAKKRKAMAIGNALINGAVGVTKSIAQWGMPFAVPFIAMTAAATAMQIAAISSQAFAMGGVSQGGLAMVGERGKELVNLPSGSRVHSAHDTMNMLAGAGSSQVFIPDLRIEGEDIYISFKEAERKRKNTR